MRNLIVILGDQLSTEVSSLEGFDPSQDQILMCEVWQEATYVKHHKKKIAFVFSAMRHFAVALKARNFSLRYVKLDDADNQGSFSGEVERAIKQFSPQKIIVTFPGEYRVLNEVQSWPDRFGVALDLRDDDRFFTTPQAFKAWAAGRKSLRMEYFYREMRQQHQVLMEGDKPVGGKWNFDQENRKPPVEGMHIPAPYRGQIDAITQDCIDLVAEQFDTHFGDLEPFYFAVTREQALYALNKFFDERFARFGDFQDAMVQNEPWMFHSHISFYLNCGLLTPREVVARAETAYHDGKAPLNAVEGFIRQILGWREYVRGIYWLKMPGYADENALDATRDLPWFFWSGETQMNCLRQCIQETRQNAHAHHIQRLMVLGNFALLAGLDPKQVNEWYLIVYADAYEWVELPNVSGMILYADGGALASKPYAASGAYINRMSNYCDQCSYKVSQKNGPKACPFNYLYWDFFLHNADRLKGNPRLNNAYGTLNRMQPDKIEAVQADARRFLESLDKEIS